MTEKQIEAARTELLKKSPRMNTWTSDENKRWTELWCRDMINSCLIYHGVIGGAVEFFHEPPYRKSYAADYIKKLGEDRVNELFDEQVADFRKAKVTVGSFTDSEGLSYNSCQWADEEDRA